ncbi:MAG: hypothetical protein K6G88_15875 [Lachnospiraceae bacterium]|nr:hypothetical protein [Lachnospiraceae bacterium]
MKKKKKDKRQRIPFSKYTLGGRVSSVIAVVSVAIFVAAVIISVMKNGNAGAVVGVMGISSFIISLAGFAVGINSFYDDTKFLKYSWIGAVSNLAICFGIFMLFLSYR